MSSIFLVLSAFLIPTFSEPLPDWDLAESGIKKMLPSEFPELPPEVKGKAEIEGCQIPQAFVSDRPHNVIKGSFAAKGTTDWAMLCSKNGKSSIFVVWGDKEPCSSELALEDEKKFLQVIDQKSSIGYSRVLSSSSKRTISKQQKHSGGPLPKKLDHHGIGDAIAEKATKTHFCEDGRWLSLTAGD